MQPSFVGYCQFRRTLPKVCRRTSVAAGSVLYLLLGPLVARPAYADYVPGYGNSTDYIFSPDPTPMRFVFTASPEASTDAAPALVVPRAYVFYARPPSRLYGAIVPIVLPTQVRLRFMDGSGEAYSTAFVALRKKHRWSEYRIVSKLHPRLTDVHLTLTTNPDEDRDVRDSVRDVSESPRISKVSRGSAPRIRLFRIISAAMQTRSGV